MSLGVNWDGERDGGGGGGGGGESSASADHEFIM